MRRLKVPVLALALAIPVLAGCLESGDPGGASSVPAPSVPAGPEVVRSALEAIPVPSFDASEAVTTWENFLTAYPKRDWLAPHNVQASEYLAEELTAVGYETEIMLLPAPVAEGALPLDVRVVRGVLAGADPTHRFALIAHYDIVPQTTQGAYDDGAGSIAELEICKLLAAQKAILRHTIECLFFDAEEKGLWGSRAFMDWYAAEDRGFVYDLGFGYDMTGINWPGHAWNLYAMIGTQHDDLAHLMEPFQGFLEVALHEFLDDAARLPGATAGIAILDVHDRNSDEQNFKRAGIPVVRFAGGRTASDYPMYHQAGDTTLYVYEYVGGRANFELGFGAVVLSSYYTILGFDAFDPRDLPTA